MKKLMLTLMVSFIVSAPAMADSLSHTLTNITGSQTATKSWDGFERMSISGTFENITTGSVYIMESANSGTSYVTLQGYSSTTSWKYDIDTTKGLRTHIKLQYTNKSNTVPRANANAWFLVR